MFTLRCTRTLLQRLAVPADTDHDTPPTNALGDWYANLARAGREQLVVVMNERTQLTLVLPARGIRHEMAPELFRALRMLLRELKVPEASVEREIAAMHPMAFARTTSRSTLACLNQRVQMVEYLGKEHSLLEVSVKLARMGSGRGTGELEGMPSRDARRLLGIDPRPAPPAKVIRLRVSLRHLSPTIWRRLVVPATITLPQLHLALQLAMGWQNCHLHEFELGGTRYGEPDENGLDHGLRDEAGVRIADALATNLRSFTYTYDLGDDWIHDIEVESIGANTEGVRGVVCTAGANRCPPEDVGGPPGYLEMLQALRDPGHPEHAEYQVWVGGRGFDPRAFDLDLANVRLKIEFSRD